MPERQVKKHFVFLVGVHKLLFAALLLCCFQSYAQQWPFAYLRGAYDQWGNQYHYQTEKIKYSPTGHLMKVVNTYESAYPLDDYRSGTTNVIKIYIQPGIQAATPPATTFKFFRGAEYNWAKDVEMNAVGELYVLGHSPSSTWDLSTPARSNGNYQVLLFKTDARGNYLWYKLYGGSAEEKAVAIKPSGDGNYYILGNSNSANNGDVTGNHGGSDIWLLKVSALDGSILFAKSLGGSGDDYATDFEVMDDGNLLISGCTKSNDGDFRLTGTTGFYDGFLLKTDKSGNALWQKTIGGNKDDLLKAIHLLPDGGYAATGTFASSDAAIGPNSGLQDMFIQRYDAAGNILWTKTVGYATNTNEVAQDIIFERCKQQLVVAAARTVVPGFLDGIPDHAKAERVELVLDLNGNTVHQQLFAYVNRFDDFAIEEVYTTLAANNFGGFAAGGYKYFVWKGYSPKLATRTFVWREYGKKLRRTKNDAAICAGQSVYGKIFFTDTIYADTLRDACNTDTLINEYKITVSGGSADIVNSKDTIICSGDIYKGIVYKNNALVSDTSYLTNGCGVNRMINHLNILVKSISLELGKDTTLCTGESLLLTTPGVAGTYLWSDGSSGSSYEIKQAGTYWLQVTDPSGCKKADTIKITELVNRPISVTEPAAICKGDSIFLNAEGGDSYKWSPSSGLSCDTCAQTWTKPSADIQYKLNAKNSCRSETFYLNIKVISPEVRITGKPEIFLNQSTTLYASGKGKIYWQASASLSCQQCNEPTASPKETTVYYAFSNLDGCIAKDSFVVKVARDYYLKIPNAFTPNKDGSNDVFRAATNLRKDFKLAVYNRWGQLIFASSDPTVGWDGRYKGLDQPNGGYVYMLQVTTPDNKVEKRKGNFLLIR